MKKEQQYLDVINSLITDEMLLIKFNPESFERPVAQYILDLQLQVNSIEVMHNKMKDLYDSLVPTFFILNDEDNEVVINQMYIVRFYSALTAFYEFYLHYKRIDKANNYEAKINEFGFDAKIDEILKMNLDNYGVLFLTLIYQNKVPEMAQSWVGQLELMLKRIRMLEHSDAEWIEAARQLSDHISNYIDAIDEAEFDIEDDEIDSVNEFFSRLVFFDGFFYNLLVLREKLIESEELTRGQQFLETKQLSDDREERLEFLKSMADNVKN